MDSDSKLSPEIISVDPHNNFSWYFGDTGPKCIGKITRRRVTKKLVEENIIDHFIVSEWCEYSKATSKRRQESQVCMFSVVSRRGRIRSHIPIHKNFAL